jgi:hypothetical protein
MLRDMMVTTRACRQPHLFGSHAVYYTLHDRTRTESSLSESMALRFPWAISLQLMHSMSYCISAYTCWNRFGDPLMRYVSCTPLVFSIQPALTGHCERSLGYSAYTAAIAFWHIYAAFRPGQLTGGVLVLITCEWWFQHSAGVVRD